METVCIVGRSNVGKSTIFNRLVKERKSIVLNEPGITRDRLYGDVLYNDKKFRIIDTGGITFDKTTIDEEILNQVNIAISESEKIIFVVDGFEGINPLDVTISQLLHKAKKDIYVLVNKIDTEKRSDFLYSFYELGFEKLYPVSAEHNKGFDSFLNDLTKNIKTAESKKREGITFSLLGRPNVGKSSIVNSLLNEDRVLVDREAGTTRDSIETDFIFDGEKFTIFDTAGIRKSGKIAGFIEKFSVLRSIKAIEESDVCVLVLSKEDGIVEHDKHIASYVLDASKPLVIAVNKLDVKNEETIESLKEKLKLEFKFISYVSFVFFSAKTKKRLNTLLPEIKKCYENSKKEVKTSHLNKIISEAYHKHEPAYYKGKKLKIYFVSQTGIAPPKFTFSVNSKNLIHFSYKRYLENQIRKHINFDGVPIVLQFKNKENPLKR